MKITTKFIVSAFIVLGLIISIVSGSAFLVNCTEASFAASSKKSQKTLEKVNQLEIYLRDQVIALKDFLLLGRAPLEMVEYHQAMSNFLITLDELELLMPEQTAEILVIRNRHKFLRHLASSLTNTPSSLAEVQQDVRSISSFKKDIDLYLEYLVKNADNQAVMILQSYRHSQEKYLIIYWGTIGAILLIFWGQFKLIMLPVIQGITNLEEGAKMIGTGNLNYRLNLKTGDELEALANQFNLMGEQLAESYFSLEKKVRDRTAELSAANQHLQREIRERYQAQVELQETLKKLQKTQAQLVQTEKMSSLGHLVAGVAHEINNPVSFIYSNIAPASEYITDLFRLLELYQQEYPEPTPAIQQEIEAIDLKFILTDLPKLLNSMKVGAERISEIVKSLRMFSHLHEAEFKSVNLHANLDSTLMILKNRLKAQGNRPEIKVIKDYGELPEVECYAGQMNQVFMNLLNNAIDSFDPRYVKPILMEAQNNLPGTFSQTIRLTESPEIRIHSWAIDSRYVGISIADNGCGMDEEIQQKIFDPFFTTKPVGQGTGLGLATSYNIIVEKHGGELTCISTPGQGTEFIIKIPIRRKYALRIIA